MALETIISLLVAERDRLNTAIGLLSDGAGTKRRGRPPKNPLANAPDWVTGKKTAKTETNKRGRTFSLAARKKQAARMRAYWRNKKKESKTA